MDKYEYNLRKEEIATLIKRREFRKAVAIADTIDWTKVRSVKTLCKISDLYKVNKRYKEARILLEQALDKYPNVKPIVMSLCDVCIKMEDIIGAMEYYKRFVQMAPTDYNKFILLYKIYEAQGATLDERIELLEELKKRQRIERWCYELALLYHRTGLTSKCVEECDDLILWFREGKFVKKAMELKMLHQQLTGPQDVLYQNMLEPDERAEYVERTVTHAAAQDKVEEEPDDVLVKTVDVGQYSTINIQKALEESIKGSLSETSPYQTANLYNTSNYGSIEEGDDVTRVMEPAQAENINYELEANIRQTNNLSTKYANTGEFDYAGQTGELDYADQTGEFQTDELAYADQTGELAYGNQTGELATEYAEEPAETYETGELSTEYAEMPAEAYETGELNTEFPEEPIELQTDRPIEVYTDAQAQAASQVNLQDTAEMQELFFDNTEEEVAGKEEPVADIQAEPVIQTEPVEITIPEEPVASETVEDVAAQVAFPDMPVSEDTIVYNKGDIPSTIVAEPKKVEPVVEPVVAPVVAPAVEPVVAPVAEPAVNNLASLSNASKEELMELIDKKVAEALENAMKGQSMNVQSKPRKDSIPSQVAPPVSMQKMLSQEYNGQISLVVPEQDMVEKQITGQININDYLTSWEDTKEQNKHKYEEELKSKVLQETGNIFTDFELQARDSILSKLEDEANKDTPVDPDKEFEEYLQKILNEDEEKTPVNTEESSEPVVAEEPDTTEEPEEVEELEAEPEAIEEAEYSEEATENQADEIESENETTEDETDANDITGVEELVEIEDNPEIPDEQEEADNSEEAEAAEESEEATEEVEEEAEEAPEEAATSEEAEEESEATEEETEAKDEAELESKEDEAEPESSETPEETEKETEAKDEETAEAEEDSEDDKDTDNVRDMTEDEIALFSQFFQTKKARHHLTRSLDNISLASCTGNVFVSGEMGEEPVELAKNVVQYAKISDSNFSGKIGKVAGASLNGKDISSTVNKMSNGGLIIERAGDMRDETIKELLKVLNQDNLGILVVMQDTKSEMNRIYNSFPEMKELFNIKIEIEELSDDALVAFGKKYAERMEYSIDEMGVLALHTRIDELQTSDHVVTVSDVKDIVDEAIENATRFSPKHIADVILGKRYDDDDMIILKERDFSN